jgi:putative ABC transport system substrate-binding protein
MTHLGSRASLFAVLHKHPQTNQQCAKIVFLGLGGWPHEATGIRHTRRRCRRLAARRASAAGGKLPNIGFLGSATAQDWAPWTAVLEQRLHELGWIKDKTLTIEYRWAEGRSERLAEIAAEFVRLEVNAIVTGTSAATLAATRATNVIPIVFVAAGDPIGAGFVHSLAHPGGNATGLSNQSSDVVGKRLELLSEVVSGLRRLGILANVENPASVLEMGEVQTAARKLGLTMVTSEVRRGKISRPRVG